MIIQDEDLKYDPGDDDSLISPILDGRADVVYGSRFLGGGTHRVLYFWHYFGNKFLTLVSNMCTNLNLTDMEVCYKVFRREILEQIQIEEDRFGVEPELTATRVFLDQAEVGRRRRVDPQGEHLGHDVIARTQIRERIRPRAGCRRRRAGWRRPSGCRRDG